MIAKKYQLFKKNIILALEFRKIGCPERLTFGLDNFLMFFGFFNLAKFLNCFISSTSITNNLIIISSGAFGAKLDNLVVFNIKVSDIAI